MSEETPEPVSGGETAIHVGVQGGHAELHLVAGGATRRVPHA